MRTRFLNKMTNVEVEKYLQHNDIIFIPLGVIETHGEFPLDVELIAPTAFAIEMAEKVDGLILGDLPYFYCGANCDARGSVKMSIAAGSAYMKEICYSLLNQGFRRQIFVTFHAPALLTAQTVVLDFFHETKCPIAHLDMLNGLRVAAERGVEIQMSQVNDLFFGAYEIVGNKDELVIDPNAEVSAERPTDLTRESDNVAFFSYLRKLGNVGFYFSCPEDHGGKLGALRSIEERDKVCSRGAEMIRKIVNALNMVDYVEQMKQLDVWTNTFIKEKYGAHIPKNKFSEWK